MNTSDWDNKAVEALVESAAVGKAHAQIKAALPVLVACGHEDEARRISMCLHRITTGELRRLSELDGQCPKDDDLEDER